MIVVENILKNGWYDVLVQLDDGSGLRLSYKTLQSDAVIIATAQDIVNRQEAERQYNSIETLPFDILDHKVLLKEFVQKIKENPTVTLAQYNTWLGTKQWYESAIIKYFVYTLATKLAERKGITLTDYTETQVLQKVRDWIVNTNLRTIGKTIGYGSPSD